MNIKFFLTIGLSLGCVVMLFIWYSANGIYKDSLLYEKQFLFKISTLESENKMELNLISSLRSEISKYEEDIKVKSNFLEQKRNDERSRDLERIKIQKNIEAVKSRYDSMIKENMAWSENWKNESQNKTESEKNKIKQLEAELQSLKTEYNQLKEISNKTKDVNGKKLKDDDQINQMKTSALKKEKEPEAENSSVSTGKDLKIQSSPKKDVGKAKLKGKHLKTKDVNGKKLQDDDQINQMKTSALKKEKEPEKPQDDDQSNQGKAPIIRKDKDIKNKNDQIKPPQEVDQQGQAKAPVMKNKKQSEIIDSDGLHKTSNPKAEEKLADDDQLRQLKLPPQKPKKDDEKDAKQFIQDKDDVNSRVHNPKILKKVVEHQVRAPIASKKDKVENEKTNNSSDHEDKTVKEKKPE